MLKYLALSLLAISLLGGCASKEVIYNAPYCVTDESIEIQNGETVNSLTTLECTDRPSRQAEIHRAGIDSGCREFWYDEKRNGMVVPTRGVICENANGSGYEILNINGYVN